MPKHIRPRVYGKTTLACELCGTQVKRWASRVSAHVFCGRKCARSQEGRRLSYPPIATPVMSRPEYGVWASMIQRCTNPNTKTFARYGGRGITVCDGWLHSFEAFLADVGPRPSFAHSLDRIDNDGNYEPGNCRWIEKRLQARNTSANVTLTFNGETRTAAEWAELLGIKPYTLYSRISKGEPVERCLFRGDLCSIRKRSCYCGSCSACKCRERGLRWYAKKKRENALRKAGRA